MVRRIGRNGDEGLRRLERAAQLGDPQATLLLMRARAIQTGRGDLAQAVEAELQDGAVRSLEAWVDQRLALVNGRRRALRTTLWTGTVFYALRASGLPGRAAISVRDHFEPPTYIGDVVGRGQPKSGYGVVAVATSLATGDVTIGIDRATRESGAHGRQSPWGWLASAWADDASPHDGFTWSQIWERWSLRPDPSKITIPRVLAERYLLLHGRDMSGPDG